LSKCSAEKLDGFPPALAAREITSDGILSRPSVLLSGIAEQGEKFVKAERLLRLSAEVTLETRQNCPLTCHSCAPSSGEE